MSRKKEKITYVDDGRTIADMSGVKRGFTIPERDPYRPRASLKEQWQTYWAAVKLMFRPMLVVVGGIGLIYLILSMVFYLL